MKNLLFALALAAIVPVQAAPPAPLQPILDKYIVIQTALAGDSMEGVSAAAGEIAALSKGSAGAVPEALAVRSAALAGAADIAAAREAFKLVSATLIDVLGSQPSLAGRYYEAFCPMADASWIQTGNEISNPYFGAGMRNCGEIKKALGTEDVQQPRAPSGGMGCCGS